MGELQHLYCMNLPDAKLKMVF
nr:unnamed protein product [Callosobruchus analis]